MAKYDEILEEAYNEFITNMLGIEPMEEGARIQALKIQFSKTNKAFKRALKEARKQYKHGEYSEALTSIKTSKEHLKELQSMANDIPDNKIAGALTNILSWGTFHIVDNDIEYIDSDGSKKYELQTNLASKSVAKQRSQYKVYLKRMERDINNFEKAIKDKQRKATKESFDDFDIFDSDFDLI